MQHYLVEAYGKAVSHVLKGQQRSRTLPKEGVGVPQLSASISICPLDSFRFLICKEWELNVSQTIT